MATRPAKAPFNANEGSGFLNHNQDVIIALTAPAAAEILVVTAMNAKLPPPIAVVQ